jgi:hypothetical protein
MASGKGSRTDRFGGTLNRHKRSLVPFRHVARCEWTRAANLAGVSAVRTRPEYRFRQDLREALYLGRGVGRINKAGAANDGLESRY